MSEKRKILVLDDEKGRNENWKEWLEKAMGRWTEEYEVDVKNNEEVSAALDDLHERRRLARESKEYPLEGNLFDRMDIFFVDYDLFQLDKKKDVTGELVAYLARCYSSCGLIVAVNQFEKGTRTFDLRLSGHPEAFADFNIAPGDLENPGLWSYPWKGYRPWYWPHIPTAQRNLETRATDLEEHLEEKVLKYLGFDEGAAFPASTLELLSRTERPGDVTFESFVGRSALGLRTKDKVGHPVSVARIAASRLNKWLETSVLPGQNILVDAPHLAYRFPSLMPDLTDIESWNRTADPTSLDADPIKRGLIDEHRFQKRDWLSRPAWSWQKVSSLRSIKEVNDPWSTVKPDFVFCEDTSRFVPEDDAVSFSAAPEFILFAPLYRESRRCRIRPPIFYWHCSCGERSR